MALSKMFRIVVGFSWTRLMQQRVADGSPQILQLSNVRLPELCPKEVMRSSRHDFLTLDCSLMGHSRAMQLELILRFTIPSSKLTGSVTLPEKVFPVESRKGKEKSTHVIETEYTNCLQTS